MDAVVTGLISGGAASFLLVMGGVVTLLRSDNFDWFTTQRMFTWLFVLTALTVGQLVLTWNLVMTFSEAPSQTDKGVVQ